MVVCGGENAQVIGGSNGSSVGRSGVSNSSRVASDGGFLNIVTHRSTSQEAILTDNSIDIRAGAFQHIEESTRVEVGLLEVQVELSALSLCSRVERAQELGLQALSNAVIDLELGVESIDGVPALCNGNACATVEHG